MPSKKPSQTEPLLDAPAETGTEVAEQESYQAKSPLARQIAAQLEALDPAPFRSVLADILTSFKGTRWKGLDADKRVKAAKDIAMLIGYAQPSVIVNHNVLHVERMNDAELLSELGRARAQLASVMAGDPLVIGMDLASPDPARSLLAAGGTGGVGRPASQGMYAQGGHAANMNSEIEDADVIAQSSPAHSPQALPHGPVTAQPASNGPTGEAARPLTMAEKIAQLRAQGKVSVAPRTGNSKAPAAGVAPRSGKGSK